MLAAGLLFSSCPSLPSLCWQKCQGANLQRPSFVPSSSWLLAKRSIHCSQDNLDLFLLHPLSLGTGDIAANRQTKIPVLVELIFSPGNMRRDRCYMVLPALVKSKSELAGLRAPVCPGRGLDGKWQVWVREVSLIMWHFADCWIWTAA